MTSAMRTTSEPVSYHGAPIGPRVARRTNLPPAPPPRPHAPLLGYRSHAVVDWATKAAGGPIIQTLDIDTGQFEIRAAPVDAGETFQDPVNGTVVEPTTIGLARLGGGLLAVSPYESRWYPNGIHSSRVIDTARGALYASTVLHDDSTGNAVVVRGTNPYRVIVVRGTDGTVLARRDVGFQAPLGTIAADGGVIYFGTPDSGPIVRYDIATGTAQQESFGAARLLTASHGWLVWNADADGLVLTRADGTRCTSPAHLEPGGQSVRITSDATRALVTFGDRSGGGVAYVDLRTGMSTNLLNAYYTTGSWFLSSGWALAYGLYNGHDRYLLGVAPSHPGATQPRTISLGQIPEIMEDPLGLDAGETTS